MVLAGFVIRVRLNDLMLPEFLSAFLNTDFSKKMLLSMCKAAIGQANINAQEMQSIGIYIPPIELQQAFGKRIKIAVLMQESAYADANYQSWRSELADDCHAQVSELNYDIVEVRLRKQYVEKYKVRTAYDYISEGDKGELLKYIAPIVHLNDDDEMALRFDNFMYGLILANMEHLASFKSAKKQLCDIATLLEQKASIPQVNAKESL